MNRRITITIISIVAVLALAVIIVMLILVTRQPSTFSLNAQIADSGRIRFAQATAKGLVYTKSNNLYLIKDGTPSLLGALPEFDSFQVNQDATFGAVKNNSTVLIYNLSSWKVVAQFEAKFFSWIDSNTYLYGTFVTPPKIAGGAENLSQNLTVKDTSGRLINTYTTPFSPIGLLLSSPTSLYISASGSKGLLELQIYRLDRTNGSLQTIQQLPNFSFNQYNQYEAALLQTGSNSGPVQPFSTNGLKITSLFQPLSNVVMVSKARLLYVTSRNNVELHSFDLTNNKDQLIGYISIPASTVVSGVYVINSRMYITAQNQIFFIGLDPIKGLTQ
ncbi:hypothetical protein HYX70_03930 [Candidatus Saccharibacteria bacterium]|nr:hypothetical protein [Candidatus Saccharibacteria bacterium]